MNKIALLCLFAFLIPTVNAQEDKKIKAELGVNASFDTMKNKDEDAFGKFNIRQLRFDIKGKINDKISFQWRQRLNRLNDGQNFYDNLSNSVDIAGFNYQIDKKSSLFIGRQYARFGGIEYDVNPIDIYEFSDMTDYVNCFLTGINFAYKAHQNHEFQFQILNGLAKSFKEQYTLPNKYQEAKFPLLYTVNWNGSLFNGLLQTRYSASITNQAKNQWIKYFAFGHQLNLSKKITGYIDWMYSKDDIDDKGIISNYTLPLFSETATNVTYNSIVSKFDFRLNSKLKFFVKGMYETATDPEVNNNMYNTSKLKRTALGYFAGLEYYPQKTNLRFFLGYFGRHYELEYDVLPEDEKTSYSTNRFSLGVIYHIPII